VANQSAVSASSGTCNQLSSGQPVNSTRTSAEVSLGGLTLGGVVGLLVGAITGNPVAGEVAAAGVDAIKLSVSRWFNRRGRRATAAFVVKNLHAEQYHE
jgi:hypothetical protein